MQVEQAIQYLFEDTEIQRYSHWDATDKKMDDDAELSKLISSVSETKDYAIFAKSAGTKLALRAIQSGISPKKCVFVGTSDRPDLLEEYSVPTLFIQQIQDRINTSANLKEILEATGARNFVLKEVAGSNHHYSDIVELKDIIADYLGVHD
jgi:hypothetical protein|tara:strand:- start:139 stop:591 length:453 start_codon:yes stop_codon:yes gene_type:complete